MSKVQTAELRGSPGQESWFGRSNPVCCPFCGGRSIKRFSVFDSTGPGRLGALECISCEVAWQWPVVQSESAGVSFFDCMYSKHEHGDEDYYADLVRQEVATLQLAFVSRIVEARGSLLDVGAGSGVFVKEAATQGWDAIGLEPSLAGVARGRERHGVELRSVLLGDMPLSPTYQLITMWDVIEHVEDPVRLIHQACERLLPGGWLVIETGNYQSATRMQLGKRWWLWQGDHRWYFAPPIVKKLLLSEGLSDIVVGTSTLRPNWNANTQPTPSLPRSLKQVAKRPWRLFSEIATYRGLRYAWTAWPSWAALPIFTIAARKLVC